MRVLSARGGELEREFPFGVVRQLFEPLLVDRELAERVLAGSARSAVPVFDAVPAPAEDDQSDSSFAALHGLYWLTVNLAAEGPLLLAVDDLHWCDRPSLRFLAYIARRLEGLAGRSSSAACGPPSPAPTRRCSPSWRATRSPRRCTPDR